jgi:putative membrane protein
VNALLAHADLPADPPTVVRLLTLWSAEPALLLLVAAGGAYVAAARRASRPGRPWPRRRAAAFLAGLAVAAVALASGLHAYSEGALSAHMLQHLLLALIAALLLAQGAPATLALRAGRGAARRRAAAVLAWPVAARAGVGAALFTGVLLAWHLPALHEAALGVPWVHALEHATLLGAAILYWTAVLGAAPGRRASSGTRLGAIVAVMPPMALLGAVLMTSERVAYAPYAAAARRWDWSALADQRAGAGVMWVGGALVMTVALVLVVWRALLAEHQRQLRREAATLP